MMRPKHQWYTESYDTLCKIYEETIKQMSLPNVSRIEGSPSSSQLFVSDGVHMTEIAGKVYVETLITNAEAFFIHEVVDLEEEEKNKGC